MEVRHRSGRALVAAAGVLALALGGCGGIEGTASQERAFRSIRDGMSVREVRALLGSPTTTRGFCEYWAANPQSRAVIDLYRVCFGTGGVDGKHHY